ncbi:hypothetical protein ABH926_005223 [Catenulispora sp. GP43]|uniref:HD domain-containing protein n=1 Tax=Catenulispora sp. GP43 TaxID=3156263 RepID=UPI0035133606
MTTDDMPRSRMLVAAFRAASIRSASQPGFVHHAWYVRYHLEIVEKLALELVEHHPQADRSLVEVLVWLHDYGKTVEPDRDRQDQATLIAGRRELTNLGFPAKFVDRAVSYAELIDMSAGADLTTAPIEVRIVSSADGCSHFIGPFMHLWWWENAERPYGDLMAENRRKAVTDWNRKIVLPEARAAFEARYQFLIEQSGDFPERFIHDPRAVPPRGGEAR